jgi:hypothetical protein
MPTCGPAPWAVEEGVGCFTVRDATGQKLAHVYFKTVPGRDPAAQLDRDEARRIAANIAKMPDLIRKP